MSRSPVRIGIFGGSFDPPHIAHFICARIAAEKLLLKRLFVVPSSISPHKRNGAAASAELRCEMIQALIGDDSLFELSRLEIERGGVSYTVDTLRQLAETHPSPDHELYCLIGSDALKEMDTWQDPETIFSLSKVAVMTRPGTDPFRNSNCWTENARRVEIPRIEISSTIIRERIAAGLPVGLLVGTGVEKIIRRHRLYRV